MPCIVAYLPRCNATYGNPLFASYLPNQQGRPGLTARRSSSGDHTVVETPVPIPNTVVKHPGPMIVHTSAKVGIASFL